MDFIIIQLHTNNNSEELTNYVSQEDFFAFIDNLFICPMSNFSSYSPELQSKITCSRKLRDPEYNLDFSNLREKRLEKFSHITDNLPIVEKSEPVKEKPTVDPNHKYGGTLPLWAEMNPRTVELRKKLLESSKF